MDYVELLFPPPNPLQTYALIFLAGSLTVSSLSDLRRMAAQADFAEVWAVYAAAMFIADVWGGLTGQLSLMPFALKWAMIAVFTVLATSERLSGISTMDAAAVAALLSTLTPAYVLAAILLTLLVNELLQPWLKGYGQAGAYPFLPTVLAVNIIILLTISAGGIEAYIL
jgi:hypothetical protein